MSSQQIARYAIDLKMAFTSGRLERYDEAENLSHSYDWRRDK
jgi:hypothetical protein